MPDISAPATATWRLELDPVAEQFYVTLVDSPTQRRYAFAIPQHAVCGLRDALTDVIDAYPEDFPDLLIRHEFTRASDRRG